ncbi:MAG: putative phycocyanin operon protein Z [bacterium ADurb.Bin243]|nr:MAG: putative phycocyanin operon protein Z [bacterium ADurb.Bin243]
MQKEAMLKIINDQSQARKKKLADALCEIASEDAIGGLYQMLSDRSEFVVLFAMERIGDLALNDIQINVKYVVDTLLKFKDSECIKMACVRALGYSRNQVVIKNLVDCLRDKSSGVRYYAVDALTRFGLTASLPVINLFTEEFIEWPTRQAAALALTFISTLKGSEVEVTLKNVLTIKSENIKFSVVRAFNEVGNIGMAEKIREFLKIDTLEDRYEIRKMIKSVSKKEEMEQLIKQLTLLNQQMCLDLVMSLKNKNIDEARESLAKLLRGCDDRRIKAIILRIIGLSKAKFSVPLLGECIKDPDKRVRANAIESLAELGDETVIELIKPALNDFDNRVKANAAKGLWKLGGARSLQILRDMLADGDKWMRASAAYALGEIGVIQVGEILQAAVNDHDNDVKVNVIKALGKIGDINSVQILSDIMINKSEDWVVRKTAVVALAKSTSEDAHQFLIKEAENSSETDLYRETITVILEEVFGKDYRGKLKGSTAYETAVSDYEKSDEEKRQGGETPERITLD